MTNGNRLMEEIKVYTTDDEDLARDLIRNLEECGLECSATKNLQTQLCSVSVTLTSDQTRPSIDRILRVMRVMSTQIVLLDQRVYERDQALELAKKKEAPVTHRLRTQDNFINLSVEWQTLNGAICLRRAKLESHSK